MRRERTDTFVDEVDRSIDEIESDSTVASVFVDDAALEPVRPDAILMRADIEAALGMLEGAEAKVKSRKVRGRQSWTISGLGKTEQVSLCLDVLERYDDVRPVAPGAALVDQVSERLTIPANRTPLVVAECSDGAFRAVEVRWLQGVRIEQVPCMSQLRRLMEEWDGSSPAPGMVHKAHEEAKAEATRRVRDMKCEMANRKELGISGQISAGRIRLLRELGRTLRCISSSDLSSVFQAQMDRESRVDGRYRKTGSLLGGIPSFPQEELAEIDRYVHDLTANQRKARITGTEIDAALSDPRWMALTVPE